MTQFNSVLRKELDNFISQYTSSQDIKDLILCNKLTTIKNYLDNSEWRKAYLAAGNLYGAICEREEKNLTCDETNDGLLTWLEDLMDYLAIDDLNVIASE